MGGLPGTYGAERRQARQPVDMGEADRSTDLDLEEARSLRMTEVSANTHMFSPLGILVTVLFHGQCIAS